MMSDRRSGQLGGGTKAFNAVRGCSSQSDPPVAASSDYTSETAASARHRYILRYTGGTGDLLTT